MLAGPQSSDGCVGDARRGARQLVIEAHNRPQLEIGNNTIRSLWRSQGNLGQSIPHCLQVLNKIPEGSVHIKGVCNQQNSAIFKREGCTQSLTVPRRLQQSAAVSKPVPVTLCNGCFAKP